MNNVKEEIIFYGDNNECVAFYRDGYLLAMWEIAEDKLSLHEEMSIERINKIFKEMYKFYIDESEY